MIGIDAFSGVGGMSLGARMAGVDVQLVIESDKNAAATYLKNHNPKYGLFNDDIRKFNKKRIIRKGEPLVFFGGPPCQGFSTSNQKTRSSNNENNWLFEEFFRVVSLYMPDWVVFENVSGILQTEGGLFVEKILTKFDELGYSTNTSLLNAANYGVPQSRKRFFIVGSLHDQSFEFPEPIANKPVTVKQALNDLPSLANGASTSYMKYDKAGLSTFAKKSRMGLPGSENHLVTRNSDLVVNRYMHIPPGCNWEAIPEKLMTNYKDKSRCHTRIYYRLEEDKPSVVIGNYRKNMLIHPSQDRGLSVREAARLQSFPDNFIFKGSIGFQQQQVGNAVPPLLAKAIFSSIAES